MTLEPTPEGSEGESRVALSEEGMGGAEGFAEAARRPVGLEQNGMGDAESGRSDRELVDEAVGGWVRSRGVWVTVRTWLIALEYGGNPL